MLKLSTAVLYTKCISWQGKIEFIFELVLIVMLDKVKRQYCANIKHNRYFHLRSNFSSIHSQAKMLHGHTLDMVDTAFS